MGARVTRTSRGGQPEPEINVTPLVDVVLVLLIIFMVITPALEHGERVDLPTVQNPDKKLKQKLDPVTVTAGAGGTLFLEKEPIAFTALRAKLLELHASQPDRRIVLRGDSSLAYSNMRDIFAMAQDVGFQGVALTVVKRGRADKED